MKRVSLKLNRRSVINKINYAGTIVLQTTGNDYIPATLDGLSELPAAISALSISAEHAAVGGRADTEDMHAKERALDLLLTKVANGVENIANVTPELTEVIITSAGMDVNRTGSRTIPILSVKKGEEPNSVVVHRKALGRVVYVWEYSLDPFGPATWVRAGETSVATKTIEGLDSLKRYWFRVATVKGSIQSEFSDPVTIVIG